MSGGEFIGVSDHGGWAILVTATRDGELIDRRRVELVDESLPALPHHHEGQLLSPGDAATLVERVRASAEHHATRALEILAHALPKACGVALRACPDLPPTIAERIADYRARNVADWVMYRRAIADAASARGWDVHWYDAKGVEAPAARVLGRSDLGAFFQQLRARIGPPWNADHRLAMSASIVAASERAHR